jgi:hypothetical protein
LSAIDRVPRENPADGGQVPYNSGPSTPSAPGIGVPAGGTPGQVLVKASATDFATIWGTASGGSSPGGRLTLESGMPVSTTDQVGKTSIFYTPCRGNQIALWDGTAWSAYTFAEITLPLGTLTAALPYDVFARQVAGVVTLDVLAWSSATARATAVTLQDGRYCKSGDKTRLYLGTFYTTSTTTTEDSAGGVTTQVGGKRFLWNYYNRVERDAAVIETTASWAYTTDTWRQANGATGNKVEFVIGIAEDVVLASLLAITFNNSSSARAFRTSIGLDSTTTPSRIIAGSYNGNAGNVYTSQAPHFSGTPAAGYHYLAWLERGGDGTAGGSSSNIVAQSGLTAVVCA